MARLRAQAAEADARVEALKNREEAQEEARARAVEALEHEATRRRDEAKRALAEALKEFKDQSRRELQTLQDAKERAKVERAQIRAEGRLRTLLSEKQQTIAPRTAGGVPVPLLIAPGSKVHILSLDRGGEIVAVRGDRIEVRMGSTTFTVARSDLASCSGEAPAPVVAPRKRTLLASLAAGARQSRSSDPSDEAAIELHLLGQTVDDALPLLDRFLDASVRAGRTEVRVVHGHGTGRLRVAVRAHLKRHPQVGSFRPGGDGEGGDGATVVTLV